MRHLISSIWEQTGTPQNPVDWTEPDQWIPERLHGDDAELAARIWNESAHLVNPRHIYGPYLFINTYKLLAEDQNGVYGVSSRGDRFLVEEPAIVADIDDSEGLLQILRILSTKTKAKRADLLPEWGDFLHAYSNFGKPSTIKDTLRRRLINLAERDLVERDGNSYSIASAGTAYFSAYLVADDDPTVVASEAIKRQNQSERDRLKEKLTGMLPQRFEHLVRDLLEAMGYEDVLVTKVSGDKGVDVVATVQFGITTIREVVQVKRHQANIGRPVLDQLRGALPYHDALRGTLISLGGFTKGCTDAALYPGAAPIGLIDGEKLADLMIEHEVGIRRRPAILFDLDEEMFADAPDEFDEASLDAEQILADD